MDLKETLINLGLGLPEDVGASLDRWAARLGESPCRNTAAMVGLSTVLFYLLEKNRNPKVNDIWDAMVYCSTCISVGYGDIFAKTPLGKLLGSALMTIGPAMASRTLEGTESERRDAVQDQVLATLRQILSKLEPRV
jgi:hypothetical protein